MKRLAYKMKTKEALRIGLIVLQSDERIELDFRRLIPGEVELFVSRVPSGLDVTPETLQEMDQHLPQAASLLPQVRPYAAVGYGCTSGAAQIGPSQVAAQVRTGVAANAVSEPVSALVAACSELGLKRLAFLSPYVENVSDRLRDVLAGQGIETPVFGTFAEAEEARVARITPESIKKAALELVREGGVDGVFLSCTNLDTLDIIAPLQGECGLTVLSSNLVLAWHLCRLAGVDMAEIPASQTLLAGEAAMTAAE
ncbi:aspartate/glutamate racemase family protein [Phaeobacter sp. 22II1-1F12B]|uniref:maleate cis-trans isomerase family protein n=1 Tax=Phaeobacter sp. 22II1-1F12B TaxID=1317111 RepID=UPI000B523761|nr:aspartate/glutamate racemase family protein [Phaeobacter sp. 22II1-1F12B]